jgi:glycosyltransferase involved in cell wall biosynthesis
MAPGQQAHPRWRFAIAASGLIQLICYLEWPLCVRTLLVAMRIAQVAPLYESVPPKLYGGTERVVSYLTEELVRQGHEVTLFASGDSRTAATLVPCWHQSLRLGDSCPDPNVPHLLMLEQVFARAEQFDLIHFHTDHLHFPLCRRHAVATITTLHGRQDLSCLPPLYREYIDMPLVAISQAQRQFVPWANWQGTVHHGLPANLLRLNERPQQYLVFTGRIAPEKRPDRAIEIARRAGLDLKIAAKVSDQDRHYFEEVIQPLLKQPGPSAIDFIGEVNEHEKQALLGNALATLFPIDWPEPFGLVMIESMACGTPTIAFPRGSVPEIIEEGVSGLIVNSIDEAVRAVQRVAGIDRRACRLRFEARFTAQRMAEDYLALYQQRARGLDAPGGDNPRLRLAAAPLPVHPTRRAS